MHADIVGERLAVEQFVGLAVARTKYGNTHVGIAFRWRTSVYLYHQAWHEKTRFESFDAAVTELGGATIVVNLPIKRARQKAIAGFLSNISQKNPQYPYSLAL